MLDFLYNKIALSDGKKFGTTFLGDLVFLTFYGAQKVAPFSFKETIANIYILLVIMHV
jgi:hypothetical protein